MFQHLLYILNNTDTDLQSLTGVLSLAKALSARLTLVAFAPKMPDSLKGYEQDFLQALNSRAADTLAAARVAANTGDQPEVTIQVVDTPKVTQWVADAVEKNGIDLVVKEKNLHNPLFDFLSTDMALAKKTPCSLLFLRPDRPLRATPKRIAMALAVDGLLSADDIRDSMATRLAQTGHELAHRFNSRLTILSCYSDAVINMLNAFSQGNIKQDDQDRWNDQAVNDQAATLNRVATLAGISNPEIAQIRGAPDESILDFVSHKPIDLLVIGAVAKSALSSLLIGSTAEELLRTPPCHLLMVKG
ncbi:universal stress protein [Simiduia agarivorans]|uniref:UspA domain-containing protein n=1 Tax=Simiduia agarivorans (strain DSM 21679 / JCM 13881 / BCRC 17597 / SA1) TaxID=1117647 RepID=K4KQJ2_SIMAS|nr:universal stress protein [Simiduia agarivorans]AFV00389.1 UspA domain-containing protein [Simiduia agarivorans SA1 = DSM 21679]